MRLPVVECYACGNNESNSTSMLILVFYVHQLQNDRNTIFIFSALTITGSVKVSYINVLFEFLCFMVLMVMHFYIFVHS